MLLKRLLPVLILIFPFVSTAQPTVDVENDTINVKSGETFTVPFIVKGEGSFKSNFTIPEKWSKILHTSDVKVEGSQTELVMVKVGSSTLKGVYEITYTLSDGSDGDSETLYVKVEKNIDLRASLQRKEVLAGTENVRSELSLSNRSNVPLTLSLEIYENFGDTKLPKRNVHLSPNESKNVWVVTENVDKLKRSRQHYFRVKVKNENTNEKLAEVSNRSNIVPVNENKNLSYHKYPIEVGTKAFYQDGRFENDGVYNQVWAKGDGKLKENGETNYKFTLKSPALKNGSEIEQNTFTVFPVWDQYSFSANNPNWKVKLGDQNYKTSPLTGNSVYGFGAGANYNDGFDVGAFYADSRRHSSDRENAGTNFGYHFNENYFVGSNFGWRDGPFIEGNAVSVETRMSPSEYFSFQGEVSRDESDGETGTSYYLNGRVGSSDYFVKGSYEDYSIQNPSWDRGSKYYNILGSSMVGDVNINASYRLAENHFHGDYSDEDYRVGLSYLDFSAFYEYGERRSNSTTFFDNINEHSVGGRFRLGNNPLTLSAKSEFSWFNYLDRKDWGREERYRTSINLNKTGFRSSVGAYYRTGAREYTPEEREELGIDARTSYEWSRNRIMASGSGQYLDDSFSNWTYSYRGSYARTFPNGLTLKTEGLYRDFFEEEWGVKVSASMPINVPIHKSKKTGMVWGRITDEENKPVSGVPVFVNGNASISNDKGKYYISKQKPGTYDINVKPDGYNSLVRGTTKPVVVFGAEKTRRDITLISAASLHGKIELKNGEPATNTIVEITSGDKSYRRISNSQGEVRFTGLKPGTWSVHLVKSLTDYKVSDSPGDFNLEAGEKDNFVLTVTEDEQITFIDDPEKDQIKQKPDDEREIIGYTEYTVKKGDWLSKIAEWKYDDAMKWVVIYNENMEKIDDPDLIYPGQVFVLPVYEK